MEMLESVGRTIEATEPHIMALLKLVTPITESLFCNRGYESHDTRLLMEQVKATSLHLAEAWDGSDRS